MKCTKQEQRTSDRNPWEPIGSSQLTLVSALSASGASVPAPAFILVRSVESGLHGLIPGPQREYALRNFKASGFGGGELSWERREETGYWREAGAKLLWSTTSSAMSFRLTTDNMLFLPQFGRSSWEKAIRTRITASKGQTRLLMATNPEW